jgi:hypothetical protein
MAAPDPFGSQRARIIVSCLKNWLGGVDASAVKAGVPARSQ